MSIQTTIHTTIGSVMRSIDELLVTGKYKSEPLVLLNVLIDSLLFATTMYNAGEDSYYQKIKELYKKIDKLKVECPTICVYKNRVIIIDEKNTPPEIQNNTIYLPIDNIHQPLIYSDVIHQYYDAEGDGISQIIFLGKDPNGDLHIDNNPVILNHYYTPNITFSIKYDDGTDSLYFSQNAYNGDSCEADIIQVDKQSFLSQTGEVISLFDNGQTFFQNVEIIEPVSGSIDISSVNQTDLIIYLHIDLYNYAGTDLIKVKNTFIDFANQLTNQNPDFEGSFICNAIDNQDLTQTSNYHYVSGRELNGTITISDSAYNPSDTQWLSLPYQALLRQAWKEGHSTMLEQDFFNYITNKKLIVFSLIKDSNLTYHLYSGDFYNPWQQPTVVYKKDYNYFKENIQSRLSLFRGINIPVFDTISGDFFSAHIIGAIKGVNLTPSEIDLIRGISKPYLHSILSDNVYWYFNDLENLGWHLQFKEYPLIGSGLVDFFFILSLFFYSFYDHIETFEISTNSINSNNLGHQLSVDFDLKVKDNHFINSMWSNTANIDIIFEGVCDEIESCEEVITTVINPHIDYHSSQNEFTFPSNTDKIKLENITIPHGVLKWNNLTITNSMLPIVISKSDILNGKLYFLNPHSVFIDYSVVLEFKYGKGFNYSKENCELQIYKEENTNEPPIITTLPDSTKVTVDCDKKQSLFIKPTVIYTGTGNYICKWINTFFPPGNPPTLVDDTSEVLEVKDLTNGNYGFKLIIFTEDDFFVIEQTTVISVTCGKFS